MPQSNQPQTPTERLKDKNQMMFRLGALLNPLILLDEKPEDYDEQEKAEIIARYCAEYPKFNDDFSIFCKNHPGHHYEVQNQQMANALVGIRGQFVYGGKTLSEALAEFIPQAQSAISDIPIPRDATIYEAQAPFSVYCALKDLIEADTSKELIWLDAYMDSNIFHRFLRDVNTDALVTLVTHAPRNNASNREQDRWNAFLDISRLYAQERGANYRLIVHTTLHDRWLLIDQKRLYNLGGSAKDAGSRQYFTLARLDASAHNLGVIETHVNSGTEYYGPNQTIHL